jgi:hypothetical protein
VTISLLGELEAGDFHTAVLLTYTLGLRFFEDTVLPRLHRLGVARIGILADEHGYQQSLDDPLSAEGCGRFYLLASANLPGAGIQHAKLLWLQGRDRQLAYVGSHNLTAAGFNDQFECTACLDSRVPAHVDALRDLHTTVAQVIPRPSRGFGPTPLLLRPPRQHPRCISFPALTGRCSANWCFTQALRIECAS